MALSCSNRLCNPYFPMVGKVKVKKELVEDTSCYKCPECKREYDVEDMHSYEEYKAEPDVCPNCKYYKKKKVKMKFARTWRTYCPKCRERELK